MNGETRDLREVIREEMLMQDRITRVLRDGPKTVLEIAAAIGHPGHEVMVWVMGMRKYGLVAETGEANDEGYHLYMAAAGGDTVGSGQS